MFYGAIIAFGAFLYFVWKFLFAKSVQSRLIVSEPVLEDDKYLQHHENTRKEIDTSAYCCSENIETSSDVADYNLNTRSKDEDINKGDTYCDTKPSSREKKDNKQIENVLKIIEIQNSTLITPKLEIENFENNKLVTPTLLLNNKQEGNKFDIKPPLQETENIQIENELKILEIQNSTIIAPKLEIKKFESENLVTPSLLLKQNNKKFHKKPLERDSPPRERFAEFLEKTVLNDDKLQSIIQNLSLNKCSIEPVRSYDLQTDYAKKENLLSEKAVELQNAIDEIGDKFKHINDKNRFKLNENEETNEDKNEDTKLEESKPLLLKRLQKQSGVPTGLNFGSVIGELKNRTKNASNGGLKPVFKKFETDTVDNQARSLQTFKK
ncbi:unnamed protein product [Euphydryas editha]|uniref:Uncharacterized protein n=1 Tax=Euphydryas editha TaxID=104508 RepID=A0AAU9TVK0_EUPED|nr:unnamed protein product [Euphydryas editha]